MFGNASASPTDLILWGLIAIVAMISILEASRGLGLSRMSLPFLVGTFFVENRRWAFIVGFALYTIGGWLFAGLYYFLFCQRRYLYLVVRHPRWISSWHLHTCRGFAAFAICALRMG